MAALRGNRGGRAPQVLAGERARVTDAHDDHGFGPELARRRDRDRLAQLALEPGFVEKGVEAAAERPVHGVGAGAEHACTGRGCLALRPPVGARRALRLGRGAHRDGEQFGGHAIGGRRDD